MDDGGDCGLRRRTLAARARQPRSASSAHHSECSRSNEKSGLARVSGFATQSAPALLVPARRSRTPVRAERGLELRRHRVSTERRLRAPGSAWRRRTDADPCLRQLDARDDRQDDRHSRRRPQRQLEYVLRPGQRGLRDLRPARHLRPDRDPLDHRDDQHIAAQPDFDRGQQQRVHHAFHGLVAVSVPAGPDLPIRQRRRAAVRLPECRRRRQCALRRLRHVRQHELLRLVESSSCARARFSPAAPSSSPSSAT